MQQYTLCHEIGHCILGHLQDFDKSMYERGGFTPPEYKALEQECDVFAKNALAPLHLVEKLQLTKTQLYHVFNMSNKASKTRLQTLYLDKDRFINESKLVQKHKEFINKFSEIRKCYFCGNLFLYDADYCPTCGQNTYNHSKEGLSMHYKKIETNGNSQVLQCLVCKNEDFEDNDTFCKICGTPIINECSNSHSYQDYGCGIILPANARYCTKCGAKSTFYIKKLLPDWEEEKNGLVNIRELSPGRNKNQILELPDDDLPY